MRSSVRSEMHALLYSTVGKNELTASLRSCGWRQDSVRATSQVACSQKLVYLALFNGQVCVCVCVCVCVSVRICVQVVSITEALHKAVSIACTHHCDT